MKRNVLFLALVFAFLMGFGINADAAMYGRGSGMYKSMAMEKTPCRCDKSMHRHGDRPMMGSRFMAMAEKLGLDEKQTGEFRAIHLKMKKESIQRKADIRIAEMELGEMLGKEPLDMKAVEAKVRQIESLKSDMKLSHIRTHEQVRGMLSPEQKKKFDSLMGMRMGTGMGMRGDCGMMEDCPMMGRRGPRGPMDCWKQQMDDDPMQGPDDMDGPDIPAPGDIN